MIKTFIELPDWRFELDEISNNVYKVVGKNKKGHTISSIGTDADKLIDQLKKEAILFIQKKH